VTRLRFGRAALVALAALAAAGAVGARALDSHAEAPPLDLPLHSATLRSPAAFETVPLPAEGRRMLAASPWWGGTFTTSTGELVTIWFADAYPEDDATARAWVEQFTALVHGEELRSLRAYVAPLAWVQDICASPDALGCYGGSMLVTIGESADGVSAWEVAAHEYGHHVAANRLNPPWNALDWGTKRWASGANVCARAASGLAFPGDEAGNYRFNPGEAFAEAYRVLNEKRRGATAFSWGIVDGSFWPDTAALGRVEQDVLRPWTAPRTRTVSTRFTARQARTRTWSLPIPTPLDGDLRVTIRVSAGSSFELALLSADRRTVLARGLWSGTAAKTLGYQICGRRSLVLRVTSGDASRRFTMQVTTP
jgi:hypothetical protein